MSYSNHGYDLVATGLVEALGNMLGADANPAPARFACPALSDLCRQASRWKRVLCVELPEGNVAGLAELADDLSAPVSFRRRAASEALPLVRQRIEQGRIEQAEALAKDILKLSPNSPGTWGLLGRAFYSLGRTHQALEWFEREPEWRARRTAHALSHCMLLIELRRLDDARALLALMSDMDSSPDPMQTTQFRLLGALLSNADDVPRIAAASARGPLVPAALHPYSSFLMRRAESPCADPFDRRAAGILASVMNAEHESNPYPHNHRMTLARWLILAGRADEAVGLFENRSTATTDDFATLCLFLWISGRTDLARACLRRMDCTGGTSDMGWFIRSAACACAGDMDRAVACLSSLFHQAPGFFSAHPAPTVWGMLALVSKSFGQESMAGSARSLAAREDPWDSYRSHLWERVSTPGSPLPFPEFRLPAVFAETAS